MGVKIAVVEKTSIGQMKVAKLHVVTADGI